MFSLLKHVPSSLVGVNPSSGRISSTGYAAQGLLMAAYCSGRYLVQGMRPRGLLVTTYYRGGYLLQGMQPKGLLVAAYYTERTSSARYAT